MGKGTKHAKCVIPKWIREKVKKTKDSFLRDTVYNVYDCGCFLINEFDKRRTNRQKQTNIPGQSRFVCDCSKKGRFLCKVKICSICEEIILSKKLKNGNCNGCKMDQRQDTNLKRDIVFYQNGMLIFDKIPQNPNYTEPHCKYRNECLSDIVPISEKKTRVFLWCYKCPKYQDMRNI